MWQGSFDLVWAARLENYPFRYQDRPGTTLALALRSRSSRIKEIVGPKGMSSLNKKKKKPRSRNFLQPRYSETCNQRHSIITLLPPAREIPREAEQLLRLASILLLRWELVDNLQELSTVRFWVLIALKSADLRNTSNCTHYGRRACENIPSWEKISWWMTDILHPRFKIIMKGIWKVYWSSPPITFWRGADRPCCWPRSWKDVLC